MTHRSITRVSRVRWGLCLLLCPLLLSATPTPRAEAGDAPDLSYPAPLPLITDQWSSENSEAVQIHLFSMEHGLVPKGAQVRLSFRDALHLAVQNNFDVIAERYTVDIAETGIQKARGVFDYVLKSSFAHNRSKTPLSSTLQGSDIAFFDSRTTNADLGIAKLVKTGGVLELKMNLNRYKSNSSFLVLNPSYGTHLNLTLAQPLLKNAGIAFQTAPIRIAKNLHLMSADRWKAFVTDTLVSVSQAYWDLVFAYQNLDVRKVSLETANNLLRNNEAQVRLGTMAPMDLIQSKTGVAMREEEVIVGEHLLQTNQDRLKELIQWDDAPLHSWTQIIPTDVPPPPPDDPPPPLEEVIRLAMENRPEHDAAVRDLETKNIQIKVSQNQLLPAVDLTGSIGLNGLAGTSIEQTDFSAIAQRSPLEQFLILLNPDLAPTFKSPLDGGLGKSFEELFNTQSYQWGVGVRFEFPLQNNAAESTYLQSKMEAYRSLWTLRSLEQKLILEVKEAWRTLRITRQKFKTSMATQALAEQQLEAEQKRVTLGLSTNFQLLKMEEDLRTAEVNALRAKIEYWKARVRLDKATGRLLEEYGIPLDPTERTRSG